VEIASLILGIIGTLTGVASLIIKLIEVCNDRAKLVIDIALTTNRSAKFPIQYFSLKIVFKNRGQRPITIIDGAIELPAKDMVLDGKAVPVANAQLNIFNFENQSGITIDSHKRQSLVFEPFDANLLRHLDGDARAFFTDAIGVVYDAKFIIPPADHIVEVTKAWVTLRKQQKSDATNPAKHPQ
jgi:hypothetical protein